MGFRFNRRIRIAPGVRLNLGLTGASLSLGPRGASMTVGRNGVYGNVGVPGSGLSYRTKLSGNGAPARRPEAAASAQPIDVRVSLAADGQLRFADAQGRAVSADAERRARQQGADQIAALIEQACVLSNEELDELPNIHLLTPPPAPRPLLRALEFDEPEPPAPKPVTYSFFGRFFKSHRDRVDSDNQRQANVQAEQVRAHPDAYREFLSGERARASRYSAAGRNGATAADIETFLEHHLHEVVWPRETQVDFQASSDGRHLYLNVDLPELEEMPSREARPNKRSGVQFKDRSATAVRETYARHIHGIAFRLVGEVMAWLPGVQTVIFSGYSQRLNAASGRTNDDYLMSVRIERRQWERLNFGNLQAIDPIEALAGFDLRRKMTKTGIFTAIDPFPA